MSVRSLRPADLSAVRSLQSLLTYADPELPQAAINGPFLGIVAVSDTGGVVGYAIALPGSEATLAELVVHPHHRRQGHGRTLVEAVRAATGADRILVTTPAGNEGARRFYESLGFETADRLPGFYRDGTDALRLRRCE